MKNPIQKTMTKKMTQDWKGYSIKVLLFICVCLLLDWYQGKKSQDSASISTWGEVPERAE